MMNQKEFSEKDFERQGLYTLIFITLMALTPIMAIIVGAYLAYN